MLWDLCLETDQEKDAMKKYLALYLIHERKRIDDYIFHAIRQLESSIKDMVIVSQPSLFRELTRESGIKREDLIDIKGTGNLPAIQEKAASVHADMILFCDDSYFGPFCDWEIILDRMEREHAQVWSLLEESEDFSRDGLWAIEERLLKRVRYDQVNHYYMEGSADYGYKAYLNLKGKYDGSYDIKSFRCFDLLTDGMPVLYRSAFYTPYLDKSMGNQVARAMEYIEKDTVYSTSLIYQSLLGSQNMRTLFERLHWSYVLSTEGDAGETSRPAAVIVCLYYEKALKKNLDYLKRIPKGVDVYIIAKRKELVCLIDEYMAGNACFFHVIAARQNRGRDLSALLVEGKGIFGRYEYVCFLHDKQTSGGMDSDIVGDDFNDILFENLIGRGGYIDRILQLFADNEHLGLLAPPEVCHGTYFSVLGNEWTNNYENVMELAQRLQVDANIEKEYPPYILSTSFWCRTKALEKLISYDWKYDDFPEEPLLLDGTLNHAIERILMYVAQDAGFYCGIVQTEEFAGLYMTNLQAMLRDALAVCRKHVFFSRQSELFGGQGRGLLEFCGGDAKIYIYGAGGASGRVADFLGCNGISFEGYIVSDGHRQKESADGKRIYELSEILCGTDAAEKIKIIVSVNKKLQRVIVPILQENGIRDYFCI